ncbi:hypothetical protein HNQ91_003839 [Filimonas zeae]|uniref:DUF3108 domain-containing protein n=1 Tax=Filimonas zeae TaxID=1737353 RepID=A0A917J208_9BACT|nr:hypothetical protein [Filimonas zeae]MDR6340766.1 hypothetical protein [Filimonas zeae]GGH78537.1 hypothetical protein GCM10011379_46590 [Filimonas zeae]
MKRIIYISTLFVIVLTSCTTVKLAVPEQFSSQSTSMHVKGLNGWMVNQKLSFGNYYTSAVKRGWNVSSTGTDRPSGVTTEDRLLKMFNVEKSNVTLNQKNKYQFTVQDGNQSAEVFCIEKVTKEQLVVKTNTWWGDTHQTKNYQYSFSAAILPLKVKEDAPWQLVLYNNYDRNKDTAHHFFDLPYLEEEGYITNGTETIHIKPLRIQQFVRKDGREAKFPVRMMSGYELRIDDGVVGIIDSFDNNIWMYNELDSDTKLLLAAVSSALMLRKIQDTIH